MKFSDRVKKSFTNQTKLKMELTHEKRLKNFQLALSMVGITANLMTCEMIHAISAKVDELGDDFSLRDASKIAADIQAKYQRPTPPPMPPSMPQHLKDMMEKGQVAATFKEEPKKEGFDPEPPNELGR